MGTTVLDTVATNDALRTVKKKKKTVKEKNNPFSQTGIFIENK